MKLFVVTLPSATSFADVNVAAKKADSKCVVTVVEKDKSYEFQDKVPAEAVAEEFGGTVEVVEYDIKDIYR